MAADALARLQLPKCSLAVVLAAGFAVLAWMAIPAFSADSTPAVQAKDAWIRWLPGNLPAAGYVSLSNTGDKPAVLYGATSADYGSTSLHETRNKGEVSAMVHVDKVPIPAHGTLAFQPGRYHIMLMKAKRPIKPGDRVSITLLFEGRDTLAVIFQVRKTNAGSSEGMGEMDRSGMHEMKH